MVVEDEDANYTYVAEILSDTHVTLIHASTAEDAIALAKTSRKIDLILMDMRLPGINGFDATKLIKKIRKTVPVIALTAYAMENERQDCLNAGCDQYITKPFDQNILFNVLNLYL